MPIVQIDLIEGRSGEQRETLIKEVTDACVKALDCKPETVRIMLRDVAVQDFGVAGESVKTRRAKADK